MQFYCQCGLVFLLVMKFLVMVYLDFEGRKATQPAGFLGFIASIVVNAIGVALFYGCGAFSTLFHL